MDLEILFLGMLKVKSNVKSFLTNLVLWRQLKKLKYMSSAGIWIIEKQCMFKKRGSYDHLGIIQNNVEFMLVTCISMEPFIWFQLVQFCGIDLYNVHLVEKFAYDMRLIEQFLRILQQFCRYCDSACCLVLKAYLFCHILFLEWV